MDQTQELVARINALAAKMGRAPSTLSTKLLGNGKRLSEIERGGSLTMETYKKVVAKIAEMEAVL